MRDSEEVLQVVHQAMVDAGVDYEAIYARLEYTLSTLAEPARRGRHDMQKQFWRAAERVTGDHEIGLTLCASLPVFHGKALEYIFLSSRTFGEGLRAALDYQRLVSDALDIRLLEAEPLAQVRLRGTRNDDPVLRHSEICFTYGFIRTMYSVTQGAFAPRHVRLCWPPRAPVDRYRRVFGCPVEFGGVDNEIRVDRVMLDLPSPRHDPDMLALCRAQANEQLAAIERQDLVDGVRAILLSRYAGHSAEGGRVEIGEVADALGIQRRRLRAELQAAGACFRTLARDARFVIARELLRRSDASIGEIALRTGFSERSTFARAFRQWAGHAPLEYRAQCAPRGAHAQPARQVLRALMH